MPLSIYHGTLSGEKLGISMQEHCTAVRSEAGIRDRDQIALSAEAGKAQRFFGRHLDGAIEAGGTFYRGFLPSGLLRGLSFTHDDFTAAQQRYRDTQQTEKRLGALFQDAQAETRAARGQTAQMTYLLWQSRNAVLSNPAAEAAHQQLARDTGAGFDEVMADRESYLAMRRDQGVVAADLDAQNAELSAENEVLKAGVTVRDVQKDLKLRSLQGEPLRPDDLVVMPTASAPQRARRRTSGKGRRVPR